MANKHQADCYRTFDGVRWPNLCDVMCPADDYYVAQRIDRGHRIKLRMHPNGYHQAFIHPDDL